MFVRVSISVIDSSELFDKLSHDKFSNGLIGVKELIEL